MSIREWGEHHVKFARRRAAINLRVKIIRAMMALYSDGDKELYIAVTGVWHLLKGRDCLDQAGN